MNSYIPNSTRVAMCAIAMTLLLIAALAHANSAQAATRHDVKRWVVEEAATSTVPPSLALAVAKVESDFQDDAVSSAGARGVMQIMPKTAKGEFGVDADELWDPRLNIRLGIAYLEQLHRHYGGRWDLALSHYNGGTLKGQGARARPHTYTRKYVTSVLRWSRRYERDRTVAMARGAAHRRAVGRSLPSKSTRRSAEYWIFDDPTIEKNWRHYLNVANRVVEATNKKDEKIAPVASKKETAGDEIGAPSHRLKLAVEARRERFRQFLTGRVLPTVSSRGHLFGDGRRVPPWKRAAG